MTLPVIISTAEEALRAVPQSFRTVSISLGGTRWQTIRRIVLPQALPGIMTGVILGLERAAGETAPILFTGAAFFLPRLPNSPFDATMALPYHLFVISTQVPEMPIQIQYGTALVLHRLCAGHESDRHRHPLRQGEKTVVSGIRWTIDHGQDRHRKPHPCNILMAPNPCVISTWTSRPMRSRCCSGRPAAENPPCCAASTA